MEGLMKSPKQNLHPRNAREDKLQHVMEDELRRLMLEDEVRRLEIEVLCLLSELKARPGATQTEISKLAGRLFPPKPTPTRRRCPA